VTQYLKDLKAPDLNKSDLNTSTAANISCTPLADSIIITKTGVNEDLHHSLKKNQVKHVNRLYQDAVRRQDKTSKKPVFSKEKAKPLSHSEQILYNRFSNEYKS